MRNPIYLSDINTYNIINPIYFDSYKRYNITPQTDRVGNREKLTYTRWNLRNQSDMIERSEILEDYFTIIRDDDSPNINGFRVSIGITDDCETIIVRDKEDSDYIAIQEGGIVPVGTPLGIVYDDTPAAEPADIECYMFGCNVLNPTVGLIIVYGDNDTYRIVLDTEVPFELSEYPEEGVEVEDRAAIRKSLLEGRTPYVV